MLDFAHFLFKECEKWKKVKIVPELKKNIGRRYVFLKLFQVV